MSQFKLNFYGILIASVLTAVSYVAGIYFQWIDKLNWLEIFSVCTSYWCTYLCVFQSRFNYPIGAVSVIALGALFYQQSLFGSAALQVYLLPWLIYGWFRWGPDDATLPISPIIWGFSSPSEWFSRINIFNFSQLKNNWNLLVGDYTVLLVVAYSLIFFTSKTIDGNAVALDSFLFAGSVVAQLMLDNKKMANWWIWIAVDIVSVYEYWGQGLKVLAIQMAIFILNALWGLYEWNKSKKVVIDNVKLPQPKIGGLI